MKKIILKSCVYFGVAILFFAALTAPSCKKDQTCHGTVQVLDTTSTPVAGAFVTLDAHSVSGQVTYHELTDGSGIATFSVKLPAIFEVTATHDSFPTMYGKGTLNLDEPRKENWTTVKIQY